MTTATGSFGRAITLDVKALGSAGTFEGYASTFGMIDLGGDTIIPTAFDESLKKWPAEKVKMLRSHDTDHILGAWSAISTDQHGLYVKGELLLKTGDGSDAYEQMKVGALDAMSIGFRTLEDSMDPDTGIRTLIKVNLREISVVVFPMNDSAIITSVKSFSDEIDNLNTISDAEKLLREASSLSRKDATAFIAVMKRIAQREAGGGHSGNIAALNQLALNMRKAN